MAPARLLQIDMGESLASLACDCAKRIITREIWTTRCAAKNKMGGAGGGRCSEFASVAEEKKGKTGPLLKSTLLVPKLRFAKEGTIR